MSPTGDITIYKKQLFRACGAPTAADRIRNPAIALLTHTV